MVLIGESATRYESKVVGPEQVGWRWCSKNYWRNPMFRFGRRGAPLIFFCTLSCGRPSSLLQRFEDARSTVWYFTKIGIQIEWKGRLQGKRRASKSPDSKRHIPCSCQDPESPGPAGYALKIDHTTPADGKYTTQPGDVYYTDHTSAEKEYKNTSTCTCTFMTTSTYIYICT